jgi:hypothetical protein
VAMTLTADRTTSGSNIRIHVSPRIFNTLRCCMYIFTRTYFHRHIRWRIQSSLMCRIGRSAKLLSGSGLGYDAITFSSKIGHVHRRYESFEAVSYCIDASDLCLVIRRDSEHYSRYLWLYKPGCHRKAHFSDRALTLFTFARRYM